MIFQPAFFGKLDDWRIKSSQKELKIYRHDHKDLVNIPIKGIDESLHGLGGIEDLAIKNGVFSRNVKKHKNFDPRELVIPRGFAQG